MDIAVDAHRPEVNSVAVVASGTTAMWDARIGWLFGSFFFCACVLCMCVCVVYVRVFVCGLCGLCGLCICVWFVCVCVCVCVCVLSYSLALSLSLSLSPSLSFSLSLSLSARFVTYITCRAEGSEGEGSDGITPAGIGSSLTIEVVTASDQAHKRLEGVCMLSNNDRVFRVEAGACNFYL
jgi:hypothetical protein